LSGHIHDLLLDLALLVLLSFVTSAARTPGLPGRSRRSLGGRRSLLLRGGSLRRRNALGTGVSALAGIAHHRTLADAFENMRPRIGDGSSWC
jgi:hypothetical protein